MDSSPSFKRLRLRRADSCVVCGLGLDVGQEALWYAGPRVVSCVGCRLEAPVVVDSPGVGPRTAARLASRPGPLSVETIDRVWRQLGAAFPPA